MKIASRLSAAVAALALVLVGLTVVAPSTARADDAGEELLAFGIFGAAAVAAIIAIDEQNDDDEQPQSP
jgi:hypothetical protein